MKRVLALALMAAMLATPALAQYYGGGGGGYGGGYGGGGRYYEEEDEAPRYRRPRYEERRGDGYYGGGGRRGGVCVTGRGNCQAPPVPRGSSCRCEVPGFGEKRGIVQ